MHSVAKFIYTKILLYIDQNQSTIQAHYVVFDHIYANAPPLHFKCRKTEALAKTLVMRKTIIP